MAFRKAVELAAGQVTCVSPIGGWMPFGLRRSLPIPSRRYMLPGCMTSTPEPRKKDPIRTRYFDPLERAEQAANVTFYAAAALSILVLVISRDRHPDLYKYTQIAFLVTAILGFVLLMTIRIYFSPRAQDMRFADFLSSGFGVRLIPERTAHYYNTSVEDDPIRRIGAQSLENSLFTKEITLRMCRRERITIGAYLALWLLAVFNRNTDFDAMVWASQVLFSEQLVSRWVRLEWLRSRSEAVFDSLYKLLQTDRTQNAAFDAQTIQEIVKYENTKSTAAITLSSRVFASISATVSGQWTAIREELRL